MKYYGNQIWNAATPSIRKATLISAKIKLSQLREK